MNNTTLSDEINIFRHSTTFFNNIKGFPRRETKRRPMRGQVFISRSFEPDKQEIRTKLTFLMKSGIDDTGLHL